MIAKWLGIVFLVVWIFYYLTIVLMEARLIPVFTEKRIKPSKLLIPFYYWFA